MKEDNDKLWEIVTGYLHGELRGDEPAQSAEMLARDERPKVLRQSEAIRERIVKSAPLRAHSAQRSWERIAAYLQKRPLSIVITVSKYAAVVLFALYFGTLLNRSKVADEGMGQYSRITVPLGQMSQVTLPDGSEVWLNSGTSMQYASGFGANTREVSLEGEAFFRVKKGETPFKVRLKKTEVVVLGTSFNVVNFTEENYSEVTLVEGKVQINTLNGQLVAELKPRERATISDDLRNNVLTTVNTDFYVSWTDGKIVFHEERLADVAGKLERWYNVEIKLADPSVGEYRFSGTILKEKPLEQIVKAFSLLFPVKIEYKNNINAKDTVLITKKQMPMRK